MCGDFSVTVLSPSGGAWAQVLLTGAIDEAAASHLATVTDRLTGTHVAWTFIDVAGVTFADATLPRFCAHLRAVLPAGSALEVCRPGPMTRLLLQNAATSRTLSLRDDLPLLDTSGAMPGRSARRRRRFRAEAGGTGSLPS